MYLNAQVAKRSISLAIYNLYACSRIVVGACEICITIQKPQLANQCHDVQHDKQNPVRSRLIQRKIFSLDRLKDHQFANKYNVRVLSTCGCVSQ